MTPYTYFIGWPAYGKFYYGVRYSKNCHPSDLWVKYFTSSKEVLEFRKLHGDPPLREIRRTFKTRDAARAWEHKVLRRLGAPQRTDFLNLTTSLAPSMLGKSHSEETRRKIRDGNLGKKRSVEARKNNSLAQLGKIISEAARQSISNGHKGLIYSQSHRQAIAATKCGKHHWVKDGVGKFQTDCPGEGWIRGKVKKKKAGTY